MKRKLALLLFLLFLVAQNQALYAQDSDGDGTANNLDQDEDNDGVPDVLDGCSILDLAGTIGIGSPIVNGSSYSIEETNVTYTSNNTNAFYGYVAGNQGDAIRVQGPHSNAQLQISFSTPIKNLTFKITDFDDNEDITINAYDQTNTLISLSALNVPSLGSNASRTGNLIETNGSLGNCEGDDDASDGVCAAFLYFPGEVSRIVFISDIALNSSLRITEFNYCLKDIDKDNIPDFLDLDSDNDAIPDLVESGGVDTDGDGTVDDITDYNNNGIPDTYDFRCTNGVAATGNATSVQSFTNVADPNNALGAGNQVYASINALGVLQLQFSDVIPAGNNIVIRHLRESGTTPISFTIERSEDGISFTNAATFSTSFNGAYEVSSFDLIGGNTEYIKITNLSPQTLGIDYLKYNFGANSDCNGVNGLQIPNLDTDTDGMTNALDLDSDGDGLFDVAESDGLDLNNDAVADNFIDSDLDGYNDNYDGDIGNDGIAENSSASLILTGNDSNNDGIPDSYLAANVDNSGFPNPFDIDTDDDGIPDNVEAQPTIGYIIPSGTVSSLGIDLAYPSGIAAVDTDGDNIPDYRDSNSDGDLVLDIEENGAGNVLSGSDTDQDGLDNNFDSNNVTFDTNDEVSTGTPADLTTSFGDADGDLALGGDLDYRDLFDINPPVSAFIDFDGIDDYVEVPSSMINGLNEFTISFWIKPESLPTGGVSDIRFVFGQKDRFEIELGNDQEGNPQIWSRYFYGTGRSTGRVGTAITVQEWLHYTVVVDFGKEFIQVYANGEAIAPFDASNAPVSNDNPLRMGSKEDIQPAPTENFEGWIDEVRIFNDALSETQIQQMVYQEIEQSGSNVKGTIIDKDIIDLNLNETIPWTDLLGYYPMTNIVDGILLDQSSYGNDAVLYNITSALPQSAPLPYATVNDGPWSVEDTWLFGDVWDIENVASNKPWSIVHVQNHLTTTSSHTQLGMIIDSGSSLSVSGEQVIANSWFLELDGTLDLAGDSQLVQTDRSDLVTSATGNVLRRQEGNTNVYWYNYWSSPVGSPSATSLSNNNGTSNNPNNTSFSLDMLKYGSGSPVQFTSDYQEEGFISDQWLFSYLNGQTFWDWITLSPTSLIEPGVGYTQKGTGNSGSEQQYIFDGKPNNGTILVQADDIDNDEDNESEQDNTLTTTFVGNPYPSALDAREFIEDNQGVIGGALYVWEQWAGTSHILEQYQGGYGTINNITTERAYQWNDPTQTTSPFARKPTFYIPVSQGFFVEVVNNGNNAVLSNTDDIEFNNGQRVFVKESDADGTDPNNGSVFFRNNNEDEEDPIGMIRLEFEVSNGNNRSFVLAFSDDTTDGFDYGYDARTIDPADDDLNSFIGNEKMLIQSFAPITEDKVIDLVFNSTGVYDYTIKMVEVLNIPDEQPIFLLDNLTGTYVDLRSDTYNFSSDVNGEDHERFDIVFKDNTLSIDDTVLDDVRIYVDNNQNKLFVKGLNEQAIDLSLTNVLGQRIRSFRTLDRSSLENGLHLGDLSTGLYLVNLVTQNNMKLNKKVIIE